MDEPPVLLGNNEGGNPIEYLLVGLYGCITPGNNAENIEESSCPTIYFLCRTAGNKKYFREYEYIKKGKK